MTKDQITDGKYKSSRTNQGLFLHLSDHDLRRRRLQFGIMNMSRLEIDLPWVPWTFITNLIFT